jgi:peptide/nickel transport system permease protein
MRPQEKTWVESPSVSSSEPLRQVRRLRTRFGNLMSARGLPWGAIIIIGGFVFVAIFADWLSPFGLDEMSLRARLKPPGFEGSEGVYILGTDSVGRDVLTRMFYGARISLIVAVAGLLLGGGIGLTIGIVSGYVGGKVDTVLMRLTDCFMAFPSLLVALVFVMSIGPGLATVILALAVITWARVSRIIRGDVLALKERGFVLQAKVAGCSDLRIMLVHILPNVFSTFMVISSLLVSECILMEATLSFLGAGISAPTPTWGNMVSDGRNSLVSAWWISTFPGVALTLVVLSFNVFGDWLRDKLDPKLRQR